MLGLTGRTPVPLFLALPFLLAPLGAALLGPRRADAVLDWNASGDGVDVTIHGRIVPNEVTLRPRELRLRLDRPPGLLVRAPPRFEYSDDALSFELSWNAHEPLITQIPVPDVLWVDPLGLVERPVRLVAEELSVERYPPEIGRLGRVRLMRTIALPGETRSRTIGSSGEFFGLRIALPSDPPRQINWTATARSGRPWVNEFHLERTGDILVLLDLRPTELGSVADERIAGVARAAAFGIAETFLREKARVGIATYGEFLSAVPLGASRSQRFRIRRTLLDARVSAVAGPSERCAIAMRRYFPAGVTTIVISPLADEEATHLVPHLRRRGFPTVVLSPSPITAVPDPPGASEEDLALVHRLLHLVRRERLAKVWRDAPVIDWEEYWSLARFQGMLRAGLGARRRS
ncbi:secreted protein containing DUF58 [mine drainage metagenome]|uniref:Secreted protein containing DUF58 n=1 Tax=mine drainage metagenome TaxID=410659 RepID=T1C670_9ZZZZ